MEKQTIIALQYCFIAFFFLFISSAREAYAGRSGHDHGGHHRRGPRKLFVFGDSYADTGNWAAKSGAVSWKKPYGMTFPGQPAGRFSDGLILTDHIASFLGIQTPVPYKKWKIAIASDERNSSGAENGMNFAHGGTGIFNTLVNQPNMTTQINLFQQLVEEVYSTHDFSSSVAIVSVAGNDYATFLSKKGNTEDLPDFTKSLIRQLELNLQRIHGLGIRKVSITTMQPLGCLPQQTASVLYKNCSENGNSLAKFHNQMLQQTVEKLNNQTGASSFSILDLYTAFMSALDIHKIHPSGNSTSESPVLKPCCLGTGSGYSCGSINNLGVKKYVVCENPSHSFFWDLIHPSQQGWLAVYSVLKPSLHNLLQ